jgi:hypothetical protein
VAAWLARPLGTPERKAAQRLLQRLASDPQSLDRPRPDELGLQVQSSPLECPVGQLQPHALPPREQIEVHLLGQVSSASEHLLAELDLPLVLLGRAQCLLLALVSTQVLEQLEADRGLQRPLLQPVQTLLQRDRQWTAAVPLEVLTERGDELVLVVLRRGRRKHRPLRGAKEIREELADPGGCLAGISVSGEGGAKSGALLEGGQPAADQQVEQPTYNRRAPGLPVMPGLEALGDELGEVDRALLSPALELFLANEGGDGAGQHHLPAAEPLLYAVGRPNPVGENAFLCVLHRTTAIAAIQERSLIQ